MPLVVLPPIGAEPISSTTAAGSCHVHGAPPHRWKTVQDEPQAPFAGAKASGCGRFGGPAVIDEFTILQ